MAEKNNIEDILLKRHQAAMQALAASFVGGSSLCSFILPNSISLL
jgi:hypothetical protein